MPRPTIVSSKIFSVIKFSLCSGNESLSILENVKKLLTILIKRWFSLLIIPKYSLISLFDMLGSSLMLSSNNRVDESGVFSS